MGKTAAELEDSWEAELLAFNSASRLTGSFTSNLLDINNCLFIGKYEMLSRACIRDLIKSVIHEVYGCYLMKNYYLIKFIFLLCSNQK